MRCCLAPRVAPFLWCAVAGGRHQIWMCPVVWGGRTQSRVPGGGAEAVSPLIIPFFSLPLLPPRSHPTILDIPNRLYYDGELQACADVVDRERFCRWEGLPRQVRVPRAGGLGSHSCSTLSKAKGGSGCTLRASFCVTLAPRPPSCLAEIRGAQKRRRQPSSSVPLTTSRAFLSSFMASWARMSVKATAHPSSILKRPPQ